MSDKFIKTTYHVVKLTENDFFFHPNKKKYYLYWWWAGFKRDPFQRVKSSSNNESYALVCDRRIIKVVMEERGFLSEST